MASSMKGLEIQLEEIKSATNNFNEENVIGHGGFGKVYKGELSHSYSKGKSMVALKRLDRRHGQGDGEFYKEVRMLSCYKHENIISLLGFSSGRDEMILVYEYASRGSLDGHLKDVNLTWTQRLKVCLDAAKGLCYLHDPRNTYQRLIHCDIKSANILLDENFKAKVSDFGLSKIGPANQQNSILVTGALGTLGYCDPLFMETYSLTKESDVYSFGVVLFEVLSGRLCYEFSNGQLKIFVPMWKQSYEQKRLYEIIFEGLMQQMDLDSLETFADIAFQCLQKFRQERPTMSDVVEKLTIALEMQEDHDTIGNLPKKYDQIIKAAGDPLNYTSLEELKALLSKGVLLNGGKTWFSINDQGKHCERVYIEACLKQSQEEFLQHPSDDYVNTRFPWGRCYEYKDDINGFRHGIHLDSVRTQFLSLLITYTVNVVFRYKPKSDVSNYMILRYHMNNDWKRKVVTVYKTDMREDGWFVAELYQFTSQCKAIDLRIYIASCKNILIAGFEFQPIKEKVEPPVLEEYQEILKAASNSQLIYKSAEELKVLLSIGIHLNEYKTWFSMNEKGQHCEMISIIDCLIPPDNIDRTDSSTFSRFPAGFYEPPSRKYHLHVHVKTQFLSPLIPYSVNLVYHTYRDPLNKQLYLPFCYKLKGETETSTVYLSDEISDRLYMAELYKFTSDGRIVDLEILIDNERRDLNYGRYRIHFEGISFQPLKNVEDQALADDKVEDMQTISDSDTYWKEKLPNDYEEILKMSKDKVEWTTKKEIYSILRKGFLIDNCQLQKWFSIDKSGKKCQMLSATCVIDDCYLLHLESPDESRFGKVPLVSSNCFTIKSEIKCQDVSPETTYDVYLVYKLPQEQSAFVAPFEVTGRHPYDHRDRYIYLASPHTPVIGPKLDEDTQNTVTRPNKLNVVPQQRSDGWMEVKVSEFETETPTKTISMYLVLYNYRNHNKDLKVHGIIVQGIELRPKYQI